MSDKVRVYFPGLNGLRFLAALSVIVSHVEMILRFTGHKSMWYWLEARMSFNGFQTLADGKADLAGYIVTHLGYCGVIFFFVLSGFLITYLLIVEREETGDISIKNFYLRRIMRIWPLYYLIVFLGFFVLPNISWFEVFEQMKNFDKNFVFNLICYVFMVPNLSVPFTIWHMPNIGHLWSIGVEEQFYLFWPVVIYFFAKTQRFIIWFVVCLIAFKMFITWVPIFSIEFTKFIGTLKFEAMAVGALGAYWLYYKKERWLTFLYTLPVQIACYVSVPVVILLIPKAILGAMYLFLAPIFLIIILNISSNPRSILKLENPVFDYLGKISYGLYMYHLLILAFVVNVMSSICELQFELTIGQRVIIYASAIGLTILVAGISYRYFESPFIRMKNRFSKVVSGDQAKENK